MSIFTIAFSLFLLMDAIGNVPIFLSILKNIDQKKQRKIIFRELIFALIIMISFYFIGDPLLGLLQISQSSVLISGGVILFIIALKLIFPPKEKNGAWDETEEPFLVPLAVPLVSGPAVLAAVTLYAREEISHLICLLGIFLAWLATTTILLLAIPLKRILGDKGLSACERFTGLLLIMMAVQMFLNGIQSITQP